METIIIINLNQSSFFRYNPKGDNDTGYNKLLFDQVTPPREKLDSENLSHWSKKKNLELFGEKL
jgi:hypothetical protein